MSKDFLLDSHIRLWVFLPIVLLTLLVEILRHYSILLVKDVVSLNLEEIQDLEMKKRVVALQKNYMYIPKQAFEMRKDSFNAETAFLMQKRKAPPSTKLPTPFLGNHQTKFFNMIKAHSSNHLPMILAGAWVSYTFSGFICTKVPFPLTFSFKSMLQRNIDLTYLDPSWVSSCSWYFLNVFGFRNFLTMFFEEHVDPEASEMDFLSQEVRMSYKDDFNNLEMTLHKYELTDVTSDLIPSINQDCFK